MSNTLDSILDWLGGFRGEKVDLPPQSFVDPGNRWPFKDLTFSRILDFGRGPVAEFQKAFPTVTYTFWSHFDGTHTAVPNWEYELRLDRASLENRIRNAEESPYNIDTTEERYALAHIMAVVNRDARAEARENLRQQAIQFALAIGCGLLMWALMLVGPASL